MESIMQKEKACYVCGRESELQCHHVMFGTANHKLAEKDGLKVWLCWEHHLGNYGVHHNRNLDLMLKMAAQTCYEKTHTQEEWMSRYGKNYL